MSGSARIQFGPEGWLTDELRALRLVQQNHSYLTIGLPPLQPWVEPCYFNTPLSPSCKSRPGLGVEITNAICERLGLRCEFKPLNWTGDKSYHENPQSILTESILNGEFDTSLPIFELDFKSTSLDHTLPVFYAEDSVLMRTHFVDPDDQAFLLKPFHPVVWIAIIFTLLAVVFADAACRFVAACSRRRYSNPGKSCWYSYCREVEITSCHQAAVLCQRSTSVDQPIVEWSRRVLVFAWGFASVLICTTYSACLVSRRVAAEVVIPFKNLNEFGHYMNAKSDVHLWTIGHDAFVFRQLRDWPPISAQLYGSFRKAAMKVQPKYVTNLSSAISDIEKGEADKTFLYGSFITLRSLAGDNCNLSVMALGKGQQLSYVFRTGSLHAQLFTKVILNFLEQGYFLERLQQKYAYEGRCEFRSDMGRTTMASFQQNEGKVTSVQTMSLQLVFWALLCGYALGGVALLSEYFCICNTENDVDTEITRF